MSDELCVGIMTLAGTLITFIVSAVIQAFRDRRLYKQERVMKIIEYKILAYQEIYSALVKYKNYFMLFVDTANEFKESCDEEALNNLGIILCTDKPESVFADSV